MSTSCTTTYYIGVICKDVREAVAAGRLHQDGKILLAGGQSIVRKAAIEPVWYLPEIARRFCCTEAVYGLAIKVVDARCGARITGHIAPQDDDDDAGATTSFSR